MPLTCRSCWPVRVPGCQGAAVQRAAGRRHGQGDWRDGEVLKEQGKVETVLPDYSPYVSAKFVTE
jgi:ABC-type taurine transport system substrate-binding protein